MQIFMPSTFCCFLSGDPSSHANVHNDHGILTASIATKDDTYVIEVRGYSIDLNADWTMSLLAAPNEH